MRCPHCGNDLPPPAPPEPPVGSWVKDKHGSAWIRLGIGWAPGPVGYEPVARWQAMWEARGPLVECAPYGVDGG